jgi:LysR family transcriptional activator of glutamate synthase operon
VLPSVISEFRTKYPAVRFQLRQGSYLFLIDAVINGEIDLAFIAPVPLKNEEVQGHIFFLDKIVSLLPANHDLVKQPQITLNQLKDEPFVVFPKGFVLEELVTNACKQMGFKPKIAFEGEDIDAIKGLVASGLAVTLLPEVTLTDSIPRGAVKMPIAEPEITRTVGIIIPKKRKLPPSEQLFYSFITDFFYRLNQYRL